MCGIAGYFDYRNKSLKLNLDIINRVSKAIQHRGPDGHGTYSESGVTLIHRRLSIIDISSKAASQPMSSMSGDIHIIFNGEIYNFIELKTILEKKDYKFKSTSDTEVLLNAYIEWGENCLEKIDGIFAFAIYNSKEKTLFIARDHFGVKPIFYSNYNGVIYFASELGALFEFQKINKEIDFFALDSFYTFGYVPAPYSGFKNVKQLEPSKKISIRNRSFKLSNYWDFPVNADKHQSSKQELQDEFSYLFESSVKKQMMSDAPIGTFLSGGIDSFAINSALKNINLVDSIETFNIGFTNPKYDESHDARVLADILNIKFNSKIILDDFKHFEKVISNLSEPFADSSSIPVYSLCEFASKKIKVAISGDGADELLGGYMVYKISNLANQFQKLPVGVYRAIKNLSRYVPDIGGRYSHSEKIRRFLEYANLGQSQRHASWRNIFNSSMKEKIYTKEFISELGDFNPIDLYASHLNYAKDNGCSELDSQLYADLRFYLPNDMLTKVDRMSMLNSLEVRVPFLDKNLVEFCWRLPNEMKINKGCTKYILKNYIKNNYPENFLNKPKNGFNMNPCKSEGLNQKEPSWLKLSNLTDNDFYSEYHKFMFEYSLNISSKVFP
jgi:asparagine synthase (glutamine-hydrolysing)